MNHKCILAVPGEEKVRQAYVVDPQSAEEWCMDHLTSLGQKGIGLEAKIYEVREVLTKAVKMGEHMEKLVEKK